MEQRRGKPGCNSEQAKKSSGAKVDKVKVRPYQSADLPEVIAIYRGAILVLAAPYYTSAQLAAWADPNPNAAAWHRRLTELQTIVAQRDGRLVGFASFRMDGYLHLLFTHPNFARQGVGTALYRQAESVLRAAGVGRVFTEASLAGRPFFDHCGFEIQEEQLVECRGAHLSRYAMHKLLSPTAF
jgi:putative acetyltransferase